MELLPDEYDMNLVEYPDEPEDYVAALIHVVRDVLRNGLDAHRDELIEAVEGAEALYESEDPVQMGWVGSDGRP